MHEIDECVSGKRKYGDTNKLAKFWYIEFSIICSCEHAFVFLGRRSRPLAAAAQTGPTELNSMGDLSVPGDSSGPIPVATWRSPCAWVAEGSPRPTPMERER